MLPPSTQGYISAVPVPAAAPVPCTHRTQCTHEGALAHGSHESACLVVAQMQFLRWRVPEQFPSKSADAQSDTPMALPQGECARCTAPPNVTTQWCKGDRGNGGGFIGLAACRYQAGLRGT